ncbi:ParB/RepB/Spo0J family partition protein [Candidatus Bathyarchaeota archaeon]|nr:MAG: ParB/RepB/Spo0J family partition protein [Candidatus Bathyarchaeota archaeon]
MKIDINKIDEGRFVIREKIDYEYVKQLAQSLLEDGQWDPIIVRPKEGGRYELISGHYRLKAAKEAGLKEIEATVRDLTDEEADILSLKTNILRLEMTVREQGRVLSRMMERYGWSQAELARRLNVSTNWIRRRLRVALELHEEVAKALDGGEIGFQVASIIGGIPIDRQPEFLKIILKKGVTDHTEAGILRRQFLNDTIFTIGYQDRDIESFIDVLKRNKIELVADIRYSAESQYKPDFSGSVLKRELERNNIKYEHFPEFGIPYIIQNPYKEGALTYECLKQWYIWHIKTETNFDEFVAHIKKSGKVALMCMERYAKPMGSQQYACHRDILADLILRYKPEDPLLRFEKRIDL